MKLKNLLFLSLSIALFAPSFLSGQMAKKYVMFEHFTQASCGPCASQNPIFDATRQMNIGNVHHVAYHTYWPGVDPMYDANTVEQDDMITTYSVTAVPTMFMNGATIGSPVNATQEVIDNEVEGGSPIRVLVTETDNGTTRDVTVEVVSVAMPPSGSYVVRAMVVEGEVNYGSAPGSNGETYFPNVFRKMISTTAGDMVTLAGMGSSTTLNFSYTEDMTWDETQLYVIAYVQNTSTYEVINSGSSLDPQIEAVNTTANTFQEGGSGMANSFTASVENIGSMGENIRIELIADQPADWMASFSYDGNDYMVMADVMLSGTTLEDIDIEVTPGSTAGLAEYKIQVSSLDNPMYAPQTMRYFVVSGVTDLIVNNLEGFGDGSPYGTWDNEVHYQTGLDGASNTSYAATNHLVFGKGMELDALDAINNVYLNVGWTFPSMNDEKVLLLQDFMDNGGNLFVSGQDIGWEVMDPNSTYGTSTNQNFYTNYLQASYLADGNDANAQLTAVIDEPIFGTVMSSNIMDVYNDGSNTHRYPEELSPSGADAVGIFNYNGDASKFAGVRADNGTFKVVYLGIGIEMLEDAAVRTNIVQLSHDWFYGLISSIEFDAAIEAMTLGQNFPNPADGFTTIPLENVTEDSYLTVTDINGKVVAQQQISRDTPFVSLQTSGLSNGVYFYSLSTGVEILATKKLIVLH